VNCARCEGEFWVNAGLIVKIERDREGNVTGRREYPALSPCPACRPGQAALAHDGILRPRWEENREAVKTYIAAEVRAGRQLPKASDGWSFDVKRIWREESERLAGRVA
jgi:hypothetical protein